MKKYFSNKATYILTIMIVVVFMLSLIPILQVSFYDVASGDDLGYGVLTRNAWRKSYSLTALWNAMSNQVRGTYASWQGTWFTVALMTLQPEVFRPDIYWITPWIMLVIMCLPTYMLMDELLVKNLKMSKWAMISITFILLWFTIQFFPSPRASLYWFTGAVHYTVPYGMAMLSIWLFLKYRETRKIRYYFPLLVLFPALGGGSYFMPILLIVILFYVWIFDVCVLKKKTIWEMCIPLLLEAIGLIISFMAPGNKVRGGENFGLSIGKILSTIGCSFCEAFVGVWKYLTDYPFLLIGFVLVGLIAYYAFLKGEAEIPFSYPGIIAVAMFCVYASMYAPKIYADVEVSGGVPNTIFQVFVLTTVCSIVYFCGWLSRKTKVVSQRRFRLLYLGILLVCMLCVVALRKEIKETMMFQCYDYIQSGRAEDYRAQMNYNKSILLDDTIKECYLCPVNNEQGPLMCMPVVNDPEAFTNQVTRKFYQKDKVMVDDKLNINDLGQ